MVVRTDEHEICERVITTATDPMDVMRFAQRDTITAQRSPSPEQGQND
jgi:hypothetical protein